MAALMRIRSLFVFTHDSIGLGEDGPTHQAIEHLPTLRMIPNLAVWRPCDTVETAVAWAEALQRTDGPSSLVFSRQKLPHQTRTPEQIDAIRRGGYILHDTDGKPDAILLATGSEVSLAMAAAAASEHNIRVVSLPCLEHFAAQPQDYRDTVLPPAVTARIAIEAAATDGWWRYVGSQGAVIGIDQFGASAPAADLFTHYGFTVSRISQAIDQVLA
jgi:transketolase